MFRLPENEPSTDSVILLFLFVLLVFTSPLILWWTGRHSPWYLPYLLWLAVIALGAWLFSRRKRHEP